MISQIMHDSTCVFGARESANSYCFFHMSEMLELNLKKGNETTSGVRTVTIGIFDGVSLISLNLG